MAPKTLGNMHRCDGLDGSREEFKKANEISKEDTVYHPDIHGGWAKKEKSGGLLFPPLFRGVLLEEECGAGLACSERVRPRTQKRVLGEFLLVSLRAVWVPITGTPQPPIYKFIIFSMLQ